MGKKWGCTGKAKFKAEKISFILLTQFKTADRDSTTLLRFRVKSFGAMLGNEPPLLWSSA